MPFRLVIHPLLDTWSSKQYCLRKELESLICNLQHVKSFLIGHTFLQHMINLLLAFQGDDHPIRLNQKFHLDLSWWHEFFHSWDGLSFLFTPIGLHYLIFLFPQMLPKPRVTAHPLTISGLWGNGQPLSCHYQLHTRSTSQWVPLSSPPFLCLCGLSYC